MGNLMKSFKNHIEKGNVASAAKELEAYARKNGGIDKMDFMKAVTMMKKGQKQKLDKFVDDLDTEPREKILSIMQKHLKEEVELDEVKRGASTMNRLRDMQAKSNAMAAKPKPKKKAKNEDVEQIDEIAPLIGMAAGALGRAIVRGVAKRMTKGAIKKAAAGGAAKTGAMGVKPLNKESELDETSSEKLAKYANKAKHSMERAKNSALASSVRGDKDDFEKSTNTMSKRERGLKMAKDRAINKFRQAVKDKKEN